MKEAWHLYEAVIGNTRLWFKLQASCSSRAPAPFFEYRFTGAEYTPVDGDRPLTPFRLSERCQHIANWSAVVDQLPAGWDEEEYRILETAYPWCETLADDCNCHGTKGRLDVVLCSAFGLADEKEKRAGKTRNVRYENYIREMEKRIAERDEQVREERRRRVQRPATGGSIPAEPNGPGARQPDPAGTLARALGRVNGLVGPGFYCSIHGRHHRYGEQAKRKTLASLSETMAQISNWRPTDRDLAMSRMDDIAAHWLQVNQSQECAERSVRGDVDIPDILYKYIPKELIGAGAPDTLRATQLLALNDDMECNVIAMKGAQQEALQFLRSAQARVKEHLGVNVPWEDLLVRWVRHADVRLSTYVQEYLNAQLGIVSFSTDILVPTMWAHYARNTGIVVGYDRNVLKGLGFELRPVLYSEIAPVWEPREGDDIRLDFVDRENMERDLRAGQDREGWPLLARTRLATFGRDWKSLSRLLFVKGMSWAYEKEVRLLVNLELARDTGVEDRNGWPVKVIQPPREAIREIYGSTNTREEDLERAVQVARGERKGGLSSGM